MGTTKSLFSLYIIFEYFLSSIFSYKTDCNPSAWQLICCIKEASMPFLRSAAMFYHYLTNVQPPPQLQGKYTQYLHGYAIYKSFQLTPQVKHATAVVTHQITAVLNKVAKISQGLG